MDFGGRVQFLQAQLFPVCPLTPITSGGRGFLGSFLSKGLKTNQLEVNTDEKTLRPIARLKEPRDLFALPKDKDNDCSLQAPRWPIECQVIAERILHIPAVPTEPEPFYEQNGKELRPNPVGEENGIVVFNYNPISAVNYGKTNKPVDKHDDDSSSSDESSCDSQVSTPDIKNAKSLVKKANLITKFLTNLEQRSSSNSNEDDDDDGDDSENEGGGAIGDEDGDTRRSVSKSTLVSEHTITNEEIADIWANKSPEYMATTPSSIRQKFAETIYSYTVGEEEVETKDRSSIALSPIGVNERLLAGLEVDLNDSALGNSNNSNNDHNSNEDSSDDYRMKGSFTHAYAKLKENPIFNPDMSLNLNELAKSKLSLNPSPRPSSTNITTKNYERKKTRLSPKSPKPDRDTKQQSYSSPSSPSPPARLSTSPFSKKKNVSLSHSQPTTSNCSFDTHAPRSFCSEFDFSQNPSLDFDLDKNQSHDSRDSSCDQINRFRYLPQFSRSAVGGSKFLTNCHPYNPEEYDGLEFESRFESGNLAKAVQITPTYYELYLRPDLYTSRSKQWFYFRVKKTKRNMLYRFSIVNLIKSDSLYNEGMRPVMYSTYNAKTKNVGWVRCGDNICYYRNDEDNPPSEDEEDNSSYTLTFNIEFENDNDTVYFAHSYPYTYSDLQDYLMEIQKHPVKSKFCKLRLLCRTLAGNNVYYLTVTTPASSEELAKRKKSIVISARVHPSETPASWMMKGLMDFITGESTVAKRLRHKFIFKLIPMLNPDGVIVGNTRNSLTGKDLNRQYRTVIRETYPSIWYTKALIKRLIDECGVSMYCDMHAHSRRHNIFIYGCENRRSPEKKLTEQVFPLMLHKNVADKFSFENCKFKIQRSKEGTGRIVVWMLGITNSYTLEASFGGSLLGSRKGTHFTTQECLRLKIIERLLKEGSSAEEPINIPLSDYSSDEGSSSSSDEGKASSSKGFSDLEGPCCHPLRAPPCSPEFDVDARKFRYCRMRKVMQELDRIYFQPLFHKKCQYLLKTNKNPIRSSRKRRPLKRLDDVTKNKNFKSNIPGMSGKLDGTSNQSMSQNTSPETDEDSNQSFSNSKVTLQYVNYSASSTTIRTLTQEDQDPEQLKRQKGGVSGGGIDQFAQKQRKQRLKVSRKLRMWLEKRQIIIIRRKLSRKIKMRCKSLHRQKKDERFLLDLPTTDPGSDLVFSTDDEYIIDSKGIQCYGTMPRNIRRGLLQSELQRRYIEEIGDGVRRMPPELIITSPTNFTQEPHKDLTFKPIEQHHHHQQSIKKAIPPKSAELPMIGAPARRTSSWHSLNTSSPTPSTPQCPAINVPKRQSPVRTSKPVLKTKTIAKKEPLSKEDLDIKLSLKKKIWTGIQPDDAPIGVDRTRPLMWMPTTNFKTSNKKATTDNNKGPSCSNSKKENEAFMTACTEKLLEWQVMNGTDVEATSPRSTKIKLPAALMMPEINEERTMRILKHLTNIKKPTKAKSDQEGKPPKQKKNVMTKVAETSTLITKISKNKTRSNVATSYRSFNKTLNGVGNQFQGRSSNKFKTGGIVATAVQPSTNIKQKSRKQKNSQKLQDSLGPLKIHGATGGGGGGDAKPSSVGGGIPVAATTTTIARKVRTKLKKKKSPTNSQNTKTTII